jgi:DNA-binding PadR family transcriptional regulator
MSPLQITILELIKANDGRFSWYQLDRALTHRARADPGMVSKELMPSLHELHQAGFITASAGHNPAQPLYSITPAGQRELQVHRDGKGSGEESGTGDIAEGAHKGETEKGTALNLAADCEKAKGTRVE